jgi:hypothetical protein
MSYVEFAISGLGALLIVSAWRFAYRFVPWVYGASLTGILWGDFEPAPFWTIAVRVLIPFTVGVLAAVLRPGMDPVALFFMGFLAGVLVCWPNILDPSRMPPALWSRRQAVYIAYAMFSALCGAASLAGARLADIVLGDGLSELSAFGISIAAGLLLAFLLWVVKVAWATRGVHGRMWDYDDSGE